MRKREMTVQNWFQLWLTGKGPELSRIFSENAVYMESWGAGISSKALSIGSRSGIPGDGCWLGILSSLSTRGIKRWWNGIFNAK